jgi:hypothetical protein
MVVSVFQLYLELKKKQIFQGKIYMLQIYATNFRPQNVGWYIPTISEDKRFITLL